MLLNLLLITFLYLGKPPKRMHKAPREIISERLGFDENQTKEFQDLILIHQSEAHPLLREIKESKTALYKGISDENQEFNDSISQFIGGKFVELEKAHFDHFLGIKKICKPEQAEKFEELSKDFSKIFSPRRPRRKQK